MLMVFSLSNVEHCRQKNDAESVSYCLCYDRTLLGKSKVCSTAVFCRSFSRGEEEEKSITFDIYKLIDTV